MTLCRLSFLPWAAILQSLGVTFSKLDASSGTQPVQVHVQAAALTILLQEATSSQAARASKTYFKRCPAEPSCERATVAADAGPSSKLCLAQLLVQSPSAVKAGQKDCAAAG